MDVTTAPAIGSGLTAAEVAARVGQGRTNATTSVTSRPLSEIVRANVFTRFNALLGTLLVLVLLTGSWRDALFGVALVFNSVLGIAQEWHAKRKLDKLAVLHAPTADVLRDGRTLTLATGEVVADDVVRLRAGDQVCADGPVLVSDNLEVDESNLTGESDPVVKVTGDTVSSGTVVVAGSGWFTAEVVGAAATAQQLAAEARVFTRAYSEVQESTNRLLRWLTWVVLILLPVSVWSQYRAVGDEGWKEVVVRAAGGLVGLVPEGLVVLTTLAFLLAAVQLTRQQALVQELPAVEGLARVDVICLDKTGTLTRGDIVFEHLEPLRARGEDEIRTVLGALVHSDDANATALAIARAVPDPRVAVTGRHPFSSARKWSGADLGDLGCWLLGAPEVLAGHDDDLMRRVAGLSSEGERVVLLARTSTLPAGDRSLDDVEAAALITLSEHVRDDAARTLRFFADQGVGVKVISGDNPTTVAAIARRVGLEVGEPVDARTLPDAPDELAALVASTVVFGRVSPQQKRAIVRALQANGHTVAMTGDGVNDVLALKDADIGIAMGNAAPATKAVAQLVLLDGRFSHLPDVLAEGRRLIGNVERVAALFVSKNVMSAVVLIATAVFGLAYPFLPRQMTIVSTLTIGIPAAILALGPNSRRYVPGFLTRVLALAVPAGVAAGVSAFVVYAVGGHTETLAATRALIVLLAVNFWLLIVLARPMRGWKAVVVGTMVGIAALTFALPQTREFFLLHIALGDLGILGIAALAGIAVIEVAYRWSRRLHPPDHAPGAGARTQPGPARVVHRG